MRTVTVLGSCGAHPEPGRACSGYLVERDGFRVVLDLGYGTVSRLLAYVPGGAVDAVVITHEHADHCVDLHALMRVRSFQFPDEPRIPLYCTPGVLTRVNALDNSERVSEVFDVHPLPGTYEVGPFTLTGLPLPHHVPNAGVRLTADGMVVAYTGDTGPDPALAELGADADLYIVEATHDEPNPDGLLLSPGEAGAWATRAGARRLMLTHLWPGTDPAVAAAAAGKTYGGEILVAVDGQVVEL